MITIIVDILIQNMTLTNDRLKHSVSYPLLALGISTSESHLRECSTSRFNQSRENCVRRKRAYHVLQSVYLCAYIFSTPFFLRNFLGCLVYCWLKLLLKITTSATSTRLSMSTWHSNAILTLCRSFHTRAQLAACIFLCFCFVFSLIPNQFNEPKKFS